MSARTDLPQASGRAVKRDGCTAALPSQPVSPGFGREGRSFIETQDEADVLARHEEAGARKSARQLSNFWVRHVREAMEARDE